MVRDCPGLLPDSISGLLGMIRLEQEERHSEREMVRQVVEEE